MMVDTMSQQFHNGGGSCIGMVGYSSNSNNSNSVSDKNSNMVDDLDLDYIQERQALLKQREILQQQWIEQLEFAQRRIEQMETKLAYNAQFYTNNNMIKSQTQAQTQFQSQFQQPQAQATYTPIITKMRALDEQDSQSLSTGQQILLEKQVEEEKNNNVYTQEEEEEEELELELEEDSYNESNAAQVQLPESVQFLICVLSHFLKIFCGFAVIFAVVLLFMLFCCTVTLSQVMVTMSVLPFYYIYTAL